MPQVLTALRGSSILSNRWKAAFLETGVKDKPVVAVNNPDDEALVKEMGGIAIPVTPYTGTTENQRVRYVSDIYATLLRASKTEWVMLWDDDILPPWKGVWRMVQAARSVESDVAGVVSVYPFEGDTLRCPLFFKPYGVCATVDNLPSSGLHEVWGGGTGLSIWRRQVLLNTIPWAAFEEQGWDRDLAIKLADFGLKTMAECSIRCRHDKMPA